MRQSLWSTLKQLGAGNPCFSQWWQQGWPPWKASDWGLPNSVSVPQDFSVDLQSSGVMARENAPDHLRLPLPGSLSKALRAWSSEQSLCFSFPNENNSSFFHFWAQIIYHLINAIVQNQRVRFGLNVLPTNGAFYLPLHPFIDTVGAETVGTVQGDSLNEVFWTNNTLELIL